MAMHSAGCAVASHRPPTLPPARWPGLRHRGHSPAPPAKPLQDPPQRAVGSLFQLAARVLLAVARRHRGADKLEHVPLAPRERVLVRHVLYQPWGGFGRLYEGFHVGVWVWSCWTHGSVWPCDWTIMYGYAIDCQPSNTLPETGLCRSSRLQPLSRLVPSGGRCRHPPERSIRMPMSTASSELPAPPPTLLVSHATAWGPVNVWRYV